MNCFFVSFTVVPAALFERPHSVLLLNTGHVCVPTPGPEFWEGGFVCSLCKSWYLAHVRQTVPEMVSASLSGWTPSLIWHPLKAVWGWRRRGEIIGSQAAGLGSVPGSVEPSVSLWATV